MTRNKATESLSGLTEGAIKAIGKTASKTDEEFIEIKTGMRDQGFGTQEKKSNGLIDLF